MPFSFKLIDEDSKFKIVAGIIILAILLLIVFNGLDNEIDHWPM